MVVIQRNLLGHDAYNRSGVRRDYGHLKLVHKDVQIFIHS